MLQAPLVSLLLLGLLLVVPPSRASEPVDPMDAYLRAQPPEPARPKAARGFAAAESISTASRKLQLPGGPGEKHRRPAVRGASQAAPRLYGVTVVAPPTTTTTRLDDATRPTTTARPRVSARPPSAVSTRTTAGRGGPQRRRLVPDDIVGLKKRPRTTQQAPRPTIPPSSAPPLAKFRTPSKVTTPRPTASPKIKGAPRSRKPSGGAKIPLKVTLSPDSKNGTRAAANESYGNGTTTHGPKGAGVVFLHQRGAQPLRVPRRVRPERGAHQLPREPGDAVPAHPAAAAAIRGPFLGAEGPRRPAAAAPAAQADRAAGAAPATSSHAATAGGQLHRGPGTSTHCRGRARASPLRRHHHRHRRRGPRRGFRQGGFPKYDYIRGPQYPKIFKFNDERISILEFERIKREGRFTRRRGDALDPDRVSRNNFLIFHGGLFKSPREQEEYGNLVAPPPPRSEPVYAPALEPGVARPAAARHALPFPAAEADLRQGQARWIRLLHQDLMRAVCVSALNYGTQLQRCVRARWRFLTAGREVRVRARNQ
ncbi:hypothetical protein MRX96_021379 [Rhipicephalus microplus]